MILSTLGTAATAVLCVVIFFLAPVTVLLVALSICTVDGGTLLMMAAWGTPLDIESFICLSMAVGLAVDYVRARCCGTTHHHTSHSDLLLTL